MCKDQRGNLQTIDKWSYLLIFEEKFVFFDFRVGVSCRMFDVSM
jgi:hypothetical protein